MAVATVNTTVSTLVNTLGGGARSVVVQNGGTGGLWVDVVSSPEGTVTQSTGVYVGVGSALPFEVYQSRLVVVSNGTSDVRYA